MSVTELLQTAQFLVDNQGKKRTVMLNYEVWEELVALLENLEETEENSLPSQPQGEAASEERFSWPEDLSIWTDKKLLQEQMQQFLAALSIKGEPIGPEALQERMLALQLTPNELSQSLIAAREE